MLKHTGKVYGYKINNTDNRQQNNKWLLTHGCHHQNEVYDRCISNVHDEDIDLYLLESKNYYFLHIWKNIEISFKCCMWITKWCSAKLVIHLQILISVCSAVILINTRHKVCWPWLLDWLLDIQSDAISSMCHTGRILVWLVTWFNKFKDLCNCVHKGHGHTCTWGGGSYPFNKHHF